MKHEWENFGDYSPQYGQIWIRYGGEDYADAVELRNAGETGEGSDNVWIISRGSIYFAPRNWDQALSCCDTGIYGPPEWSQVAYAFYAYAGLDLDFLGNEVVQIGKRDSFGDEVVIRSLDCPDVVLHGNASISKYLERQALA